MKSNSLSVGDFVFWYDPDGETSDYYYIEKINGDIYLLVNEEGTETEATKNEIELIESGELY